MLHENPSLLRWRLVHLTSLPDEMLKDEFDGLMSLYAERQRDEALIREYQDREWGRFAIENDASDVYF